MDIIDEQQALRDLKLLKAEETIIELVINNIKLYNQLVLDYTVEGITKNLYLTYQLNVQISKQLMDLKKLNRPKEASSDDEDPLSAMINKLKNDKPKTKKK